MGDDIVCPVCEGAGWDWKRCADEDLLVDDPVDYYWCETCDETGRVTAVADIGLHSADTTGDRSQPGAWFVYDSAYNDTVPLALFNTEAAARRWCDESFWGLVVFWPFGKEWDEVVRE